MLTVACAECHIKAPYAECHYAECHNAECRGTSFGHVHVITKWNEHNKKH
jgi:hypothetical protein